MPLAGDSCHRVPDDDRVVVPGEGLATVDSTQTWVMPPVKTKVLIRLERSTRSRSVLSNPPNRRLVTTRSSASGCTSPKNSTPQVPETQIGIDSCKPLNRLND